MEIDPEDFKGFSAHLPMMGPVVPNAYQADHLQGLLERIAETVGKAFLKSKNEAFFAYHDAQNRLHVFPLEQPRNVRKRYSPVKSLAFAQGMRQSAFGEVAVSVFMAVRENNHLVLSGFHGMGAWGTASARITELAGHLTLGHFQYKVRGVDLSAVPRLGDMMPLLMGSQGAQAGIFSLDTCLPEVMNKKKEPRGPSPGGSAPPSGADPDDLILH